MVWYLSPFQSMTARVVAVLFTWFLLSVLCFVVIDFVVVAGGGGGFVVVVISKTHPS